MPFYTKTACYLNKGAHLLNANKHAVLHQKIRLGIYLAVLSQVDSWYKITQEEMVEFLNMSRLFYLD